MATLIEETSTVTAKNQTTVPKAVRAALGIGSGDRIVYRIAKDGSVALARQVEQDDEAAVTAFLKFISNDIKRRPEAIKPMRQDDVDRRAKLLEGVEIDLDGDFPDVDPI
ncbi:MAG: type II toxin-antitoxin system PrlF family antitoxin [Pseudomonadota bacterium]|nr:type II toxin-antitoxin system PrlF family antitoxin [Pseudomonadota bacterium]